MVPWTTKFRPQDRLEMGVVVGLLITFLAYLGYIAACAFLGWFLAITMSGGGF